MKGLLILSIFLAGSFCVPLTLEAAELVLDTQVTVKAEVLEVVSQEERIVPGTDTETEYQTLKIKILEGEEEGKEITIDNDYLHLEKGEVFYLVHTSNTLEGRDYYSVSDPYRLNSLYFFVGLFILCVLVFGGVQGMRGLLSLIGSFFLIGFVLLPGILHGFSPILLSIGVSSLIIIFGSYVTHGFTRTTTSAIAGMIVTIIVTGLLAYAAVHFTRLSGFSSEESVYLNFDTRGTIDFAGLLLGGIIIGVLGVLYDAAIGQAVSVEELSKAAPHFSRRTVYLRALRIGREHIGALVNILAIAYVGAFLPLLLLFYSASSVSDFGVIINREVFASEITRIIIGSIGLILAVPITTFISVCILVKKTSSQSTV